MPAPPSTVLRLVGAVTGPHPPGCCRICRAPVRSGYSTCTTCRRLALALGRPLAAVTPIAVVGPTSSLYRALRQYKSGEPEVARRQRARLASVLSEFADRCLTSLVPGADLVVVVPSGDRRRPPPHPLVAVAEAAGLGEVAVGALRPGAVPVDHGRPSLLAYRAAHEVAGRAVVVLDDVYTTGAHLQSAAMALTSAGARAVHPVVIGRYVTPLADRQLQGSADRMRPAALTGSMAPRDRASTLVR